MTVLTVDIEVCYFNKVIKYTRTQTILLNLTCSVYITRFVLDNFKAQYLTYITKIQLGPISQIMQNYES